jgi:alkylation response protein AidB-like acyl-CoA dehydrogenase
VPFRAGPEPGALGLALVPRDAEGLAAEDAPGMDATKRLGRVRLEGVRVAPEALLGEPGPAAAAALERLLDLAAAAVTAEAIGAAEGAHALVVRYAKQRTQFGSPIGRFQGVKHPLAEMYVDIESFKSLLYYAAWALDERHPDAPRAVSMAKAYASEAFARIGLDGVQLHGALGYTWEYDAQLYLKRAKWLRPMYGDADHHYERVARLGGL